jgi:hypothetical protein
MKKLYKAFTSLFLLVFFIGCEKEKPESSIIFNEKTFLDSILDINKYKIVEKTKDNDSIYSIKAINKDKYILTGYLNLKDSDRIRWWTLTKDNKKLLKVEYLFDGEKTIRNQIIIFNNNQIDTLQSKFYTKKILEGGKIKLDFYTPKFAFPNSEVSTELIYSFINKNDYTDKQTRWLKKIGNHYTCIINIPDSLKTESSIKAMLIERETKGSLEGLNQIFFEETIK